MWESDFIWKMNYPLTCLFWIYRYIKESHASACFLITHAALNSLSECTFQNYSFCSINVSSNCTQIFGNNTLTCPNLSMLLEHMLFLCPILKKSFEPVGLDQISFDPFSSELPNLVHWLPLESRSSLLIFRSHTILVKDQVQF